MDTVLGKSALRDGYGDQAQELYEEERAVLRVYPLDATGALVLTQPVASFDQLIIARVDEPDRDRVQYSQSFDGHKLYAYGSDHRIYSVSAAVIDTELSAPLEAPVGSAASAWAGRGHRDWVEFFETYASVWACAKARYLVQMTYGRRQVYGAIVDTTPSMMATAPHKFDVLFSFYVTHSQVIDF